MNMPRQIGGISQSISGGFRIIGGNKDCFHDKKADERL
jgi:hypothetical protein